jgi:large subunit ribosomal protein L6
MSGEEKPARPRFDLLPPLRPQPSRPRPTRPVRSLPTRSLSMASSLRTSFRSVGRSIPSRPSTFLTPFAFARSFSVSPVFQYHIGSAPILHSPQTKVSTSPSGNELIITGPKGTETVPILEFVRLFYEPSPNDQTEGRIEVAVDDQRQRFHRAMWGTTRTNIANAIEGVTDGVRLPIKFVGVGYRAAVEEAPRPPTVKAEDWVGKQRLNLKLGYSHPIHMLIPEGVVAEVPLPTKIILSGSNKYKVTQFAADIRRWRKPEPYRGKVSLFTLEQPFLLNCSLTPALSASSQGIFVSVCLPCSSDSRAYVLTLIDRLSFFLM